MTKTEAINLLNTAIDCYIEDTLIHGGEDEGGEPADVWEAFTVVRDLLEEGSDYENARASIKFLLTFCKDYEIRGIDPFMLNDVHEEIVHMEAES